MNKKTLDFNEPFFGDLHEYKDLSINLMNSLKNISYDDTLSEETGSNDLLTDMVLNITDMIMDNMDQISENLYSNDLITHEFPLFLEAKEIIQWVLMDPIHEDNVYLNLAIDVFSEFFTLLEVKLLLFEGCLHEIEASDEIIDEYDKELNNYVERFKKYRNKFIELNN